MNRIKRSKESGVALKSQLTLSSWLPHSDEACPVCDSEPTSQRLAGTRRGLVGRPRNDDVTHLSREVMRAVNNINPPQYSHLPLERAHFVPIPIIPRLVCQHCNCVPNRPIELLPCHHLMCVSCIATITETHILTCSCSPVETEVVEPHPVVIQLLQSLLLNCPKGCGQVITLQDLLQHNCVRKYPPPLNQITVQHLLDSPPGSAVEQQAMGLLVEKFLPSGGSVTYKSSSGKVHALIQEFHTHTQ